MASVRLIQYEPKFDRMFQHGFAQTAETLFQMAFGAGIEKLDQEVLSEINETRTLFYARLSDSQIQYQSTLEKLKTELKEIGEL
ncbi:protein of unknown function [Pseudotevenvirus RB43]|uniref:Uncharacterized protein n=1 Tax=Pseudotevenvirus RB43 TaxID=115991 RepID=K0NMW5_9CAUD|nr:protein of unknown function [Pseudotevenvirus RB43]CCL97649.1 protein of unknown function [Pseudotevenvirus RB43]